MENEENKIKEDKLAKYGITKKTIWSMLTIVATVVLIIVLSITSAGFKFEKVKTLQFWINVIILLGISIFSLITGQQIGDDSGKNNPKGRYRNSLKKYRDSYDAVDKKKAFSGMDDWLENLRQRKLKNKIRLTLENNGVHQMEVLDLDITELSNLTEPYKKSWKGTNAEHKYKDDITYFKSYTAEQIQVIRDCLNGKVKMNSLRKSFFVDVFNQTNKDIWESAGNADSKKNSYVRISYSYKLLSLIAFSIIWSGLDPALNDGITASQLWLSLVVRLFNLTVSVVWGFYVGSELVKIDADYIDFKTDTFKQYVEELENGTYKAKTLEETAKEEYEEFEKSKINPEIISGQGSSFILLSNKIKEE